MIAANRIIDGADTNQAGIDHTDTVYARFAATAARYPARAVLNIAAHTANAYNIEPDEITYHSALSQINTLADAFDTAGYAAGMRVALLLENRPSYFIYWLALNRIGASVVPVNPDLRAVELEYLVAHSEPALIVAITARHSELIAASQTSGIALDVIAPFDTLPKPSG